MSEREFQSVSNIPTNVPAVASDEGRVLGKYRLTRKLGQGGMGEVWQARDTVAMIDVAVKFLPLELRRSEEAQEQLSESYRKVHGLHHPHICAVKDLILDPVVGYFLVMDYFEGLTLAKYRKEYIQKHKKFPVEELVRILKPVAEALDYAHGQGLLHRDIKPGNVLVGPGGQKVRVIDFQLATEIRSTLSRYTNARFDTSGTYPYMAPEQFRGAHASPATDQYALAMTAYELLAGQLPFEALGWDMWKGVVTDPQTSIPAIPGLSRSAQAALECGLAFDPKKRASSCQAFLSMCLQTERVPPLAKEFAREVIREPIAVKEPVKQTPQQPPAPTPSIRQQPEPQKSKAPPYTSGNSARNFYADQLKTAPPPPAKNAPAPPPVRQVTKPAEPAPAKPARSGFAKSFIQLLIVGSVGVYFYYRHPEVREWVAKTAKQIQDKSSKPATNTATPTSMCEVTYYVEEMRTTVEVRTVVKDGVAQVEPYDQFVPIEVTRTLRANSEPTVREVTVDGKVRFELTFADPSISKVTSTKKPTWRWIDSSSPSVVSPTYNGIPTPPAPVLGPSTSPYSNTETASPPSPEKTPEMDRKPEEFDIKPEYGMSSRETGQLNVPSPAPYEEQTSDPCPRTYEEKRTDAENLTAPPAVAPP